MSSDPIATGPLTPSELNDFRFMVEHGHIPGRIHVARLYHAYLALLAQLQDTPN